MRQHDGERDGPVPPAQAAGAAPQAAAGGFRIALRRRGPAVELTLTASDDYAGMELYDSLLRSIKSGHLRFDIDLAQP